VLFRSTYAHTLTLPQIRSHTHTHSLSQIRSHSINGMCAVSYPSSGVCDDESSERECVCVCVCVCVCDGKSSSVLKMCSFRNDNLCFHKAKYHKHKKTSPF